MLNNWVFDGFYYLALLKHLGILTGLSIIAVLCAVMLFLIKNFYYAYTNGKQEGENRYWIYYVKDVIKDFKELCGDFDWIKQILIIVKERRAPSYKRPSNGFSSVFLNKRTQLPPSITKCSAKHSHIKRIITRGRR